MSAGNLRAWLEGEREQLRWIEFAAYAARVFASGNEHWLTDPNVFAGGITQAQGVVATEVLGIDLLAPYMAGLEPDQDAPGGAVQAMFEQGPPAAFLVDIVDALAHSLAGTVDLVLKIAAPADVLRAAGLADEPSFDDLDDTAIALAGVLRSLSERPIAGILVTTCTDFSDDEAEALESVISTARHYDWNVAVSFDRAAGPGEISSAIDTDVALYPACPFAALTGDGTVGGGLDEVFWSGEGSLPNAPRYLAYGVIPPDAQPETVVAQAAALK